MAISESISSEVQAVDRVRNNALPTRISQLYRGSRDQFHTLVREIRRDRAACVTAGLFVLFVLPTCLLLAVLVPPGEVADEMAHVLRADSLLQGEILGHRQPVSENGKIVLHEGLDANPALVAADVPFPGAAPGHLDQKKLTPVRIAALESIPWAKTAVFLATQITCVYMPVFYVPAAVVIGLAQAFHFSPYHAILGARIANALCFVVIGIGALLLARRGRMLLFCVLTLPMTVSLAASVNQDGLLIASSALAFALLTRASHPRGRAYWAAAILIATVIMVKIAYGPLALLLLIPCNWRRPYKKMVLAGMCTAVFALIPGIVWAAIAAHFVATPYPTYDPYHPGYLWPGDHNAIFTSPDAQAQMEVFLHRPLYPVVLPMKSVSVQWPGLRDQMVGMFGWLEFGLPKKMYTFWVLAIAFAVLSDVINAASPPRAPVWGAIGIGFIAVFGALCAVFDAEYLTWTRVGAQLIEGQQGRHLLPLLAALAVFIPAGRIRGAAGLQTILAIPAFAMAAAGMVVLPTLMVSTYYLR